MKRQTTSSVTLGAKRAEDREHAEQQQVELVDEAAAEPVAELTLAGGADEHAEDGGAADRRRLRRRSRTSTDRMYGTSEPKIVKSMTSKKYPAAISPTTLAMQRRYLRVVQRVADKCLDCLSHGVSLPMPVSIVSTQQPTLR